MLFVWAPLLPASLKRIGLESCGRGRTNSGFALGCPKNSQAMQPECPICSRGKQLRLNHPALRLVLGACFGTA